jgi:hypothetical protein
MTGVTADVIAFKNGSHTNRVEPQPTPISNLDRLHSSFETLVPPYAGTQDARQPVILFLRIIQYVFNRFRHHDGTAVPDFMALRRQIFRPDPTEA